VLLISLFSELRKKAEGKRKVGLSKTLEHAMINATAAMAVTQIADRQSPALSPRPSRAELLTRGEALRANCPRSSHAFWRPSKNRIAPLVLIKQADKGRLPELLPIRHGRMMKSPFTFYRGAALNMAADLATTPISGPRAQACGDAHLLNFGVYATPERRLVFDINDLDETLPAPWEWDVKRLATSFVLACRSNGLTEDDASDSVLACVRSYREHMAEFSRMRALDVWYAGIDVEKRLSNIKNPESRKRFRKRLAKARKQNIMEHDFPKLADTARDSVIIKDNPPLIYHADEFRKREYEVNLRQGFARYRDSLPEERRILLDRFEIKDSALKVVGVGSVGTFCAILLLMAAEDDPLFLQVKEATASVLEPYAGKSVYSNHGERVVRGCRLMQSASDLFLGWTEGKLGRHFYVRQLRDMKIKPLVELFNATDMVQYAETCGFTLARAHARSGESALISGYLGQSDTFDKAIAAFTIAYADQSEKDHGVLMKAVRNGDLEVVTEPS
jgi:uncharacterized protein (DUF2252 family)